MADNIIDYLKKEGNQTFAERPFSDVDALLLSQFCYLKFDGFVAGPADNKPFVSLKDLCQREEADSLFSDTRRERIHREMVAAMLESKRFQNLELNYYISITELENESQFAAVVIRFRDESVNHETPQETVGVENHRYSDVFFVAYRGTDETLVGWKEDLNLTYMKEVPGQFYAVRYMNAVEKYLGNHFYVGGHSKGGNLAVYTAMKSRPELQDRMIKIFNMDGPGFLPEVLEESDFDRIRPKVRKLLPQSSLFGMLFQWDDDYTVIRSTATSGVEQHSPFTWEVEQGELVYEEKVENSAVFIDQTLNDWILSIHLEKRKDFALGVHKVMQECEAKDLITLGEDTRKYANQVINAAKNLDEETKEMMKQVFRELFVQGKRRASIEVPERTEEAFHELKEKTSSVISNLQEKTTELFQELQDKMKSSSEGNSDGMD